MHTDQLRQEEAREAGPVHVGHQMWLRLGIDDTLLEVGLSPEARRLTEVMVLIAWRLRARNMQCRIGSAARRWAIFWAWTCGELTDEVLYRSWIACTRTEARSRRLWRSGKSFQSG